MLILLLTGGLRDALQLKKIFFENLFFPLFVSRGPYGPKACGGLRGAKLV